MIRIEFSKNKDNVINLASEIFSEFDLYWFKYWLNNGKLIECYYDNSLVGFCLVLIKPVMGIKGGIIMYIGVKENYRRKGIGSKILSFTENYFILHKCDSAFATTRIENKVAISFFLKNNYRGFFINCLIRRMEDGFKLVRALHAYEDDILFIKKLKNIKINLYELEECYFL